MGKALTKRRFISGDWTTKAIVSGVFVCLGGTVIAQSWCEFFVKLSVFAAVILHYYGRIYACVRLEAPGPILTGPIVDMILCGYLFG